MNKIIALSFLLFIFITGCNSIQDLKDNTNLDQPQIASRSSLQAYMTFFHT